MSSRKKEEKLCPEQMTEHAEALGRQIQQDRQEAGFSREEIEHLTKISPFFLEALEAGHFQILPGEVFCKGFVRNIYRVLKKDPHAVVAEIETAFVLIRQAAGPAERKRNIPSHRSFGPSHKADNSRLRYWSIVALLLVVGGALIWRVRHVRPALNPVDLSANEAPPTIKKAEVTPGPAAILPPKVAVGQPEVTAALPIPIPVAPIMPLLVTPVTALPTTAEAEAHATVPQSEANPLATPEPEKELAAKSNLTMLVRAPVGVRQKIDGVGYASKEYAQGEYQFAFKDKAEFVVKDAAQVSFTFDSKNIETLGKKKETKKITFVHSKQATTLIQ